MRGVTKKNDIFRELNILTVTSLYILEVLSYSKKHNINNLHKLHNKLPMEIRKVKGERKFKHRLKRYLLEHPYYALQVFLSEGQ
jgi:hypothetical protein